MVKDMTKGSPIKLVISFALPLLIGTLFQQFYSIVDMMIVGQFVSKQALASVGSTASVNFLVIGFILGFTSGIGILVSQLFGSGDYSGMRKLIANGIYLVAVISVVITTFAALFCRNILQIMNTPADMMTDSNTYMFIMFCGIPATVLYNFSASVLRSLGDSKTPTKFIIVASIINVGLDLAFVLLFNMGVAGVALATVIANFVSGVLCVFSIHRKFPILRFEKSDFTFNAKTQKKLLMFGLPMALNTSITMLSCAIIQAATNSLGTDAAASVAAASKIENIFMTAFQVIALAIATYAGQNLGAKKIHRVRKGFRQTAAVTTAYAVVVGLILIFCGKYLALIYIKPNETHVLSLVSQYCSTIGFAFIFLGLLYVARSTVQALGYTMFTMIGGITELVARSAVALILVKPIGYTAICIAGPVAWISVCVILVFVYRMVLNHLTAQYPYKKLKMSKR